MANIKKQASNIYGLLHDGDEVLISFRTELKNPMAVTNMMHQSSNEQFQFSIQSQQVSAFAESLGFELSQKMLCQDLLNWINYPITNPAALRGDNYYLLKRNSLTLTNRNTETKSIEDVPLIASELLDKLKRENNTYRMCNII